MGSQSKGLSLATRRWLGVGGVVVVLVALCGFFEGASGSPFSMLIWSLSFTLMWGVGLVAVGGVWAPEVVEDYLRLELLRWMYALVLFPAACVMGATAWWCYWP
jgi:hypothetical protein